MVPHTPKPSAGQPLSRSLLDSYNNCVRGARGINHGKPRKARTGRIDQALAPAIDFADGTAVDQHGHLKRPSGDTDRHDRGIGSVGAIDVDPRAVERELDVERLLAPGPNQFADGTEPPER